VVTIEGYIKYKQPDLYIVLSFSRFAYKENICDETLNRASKAVKEAGNKFKEICNTMDAIGLADFEDEHKDTIKMMKRNKSVCY